MDKSIYNSSWYNNRPFLVVEVPYPVDCDALQSIFAEHEVEYDSRVNPETGKPVFIIFEK